MRRESDSGSAGVSDFAVSFAALFEVAFWPPFFRFDAGMVVLENSGCTESKTQDRQTKLDVQSTDMKNGMPENDLWDQSIEWLIQIQ